MSLERDTKNYYSIIQGNVLDVIKIASAQGRGHIQSLFKYEDGTDVPVRYVDKKRIQGWLNANRLQLPLRSPNQDSNLIVPESGSNVKHSVAGAEKILEEVMQRRLKEAAEKYGTIPAGENPVRDVRIPKQTSEGKRASFTVRTVLEAGITPDELVPKLTEEILNGTFSDDVHTNKETVKKGEDWMAKFTEVEKAMDVFIEEVRSGENISEETTMRGYILYNQLADAAAKELLKITGHRFISMSLN